MRSLRGVLAGLTILCAVFNFPFAPQAIAWFPHGVQGSGACPQVVDGGCASSPGGNFTQAGFSAHARQSGQSWTGAHPWNWNSCGIDYACGYYTATASLHDPASQQPTNCTYNATGSYAPIPGGSGSGPLLTCGGGAVDIEGYDFSLHNGVILYLQSSTTSATVKNNKFAAGSNVLNATAMFDLGNLATTNLDFESNNLDGGGSGGVGTNGDCIELGIHGTVTLKYNVITNCDARPIDIISAGASVLSEFNYVENFVYTSSSHGEYWGGMNGLTGGPYTMQSSYDTVLEGSIAKQNGSTSLVYFSTGNAGPAITVQLDHLVGVSNLNSGVNTVSAIAEAAFNTFTNITISNSYIDSTGSLNDWNTLTDICTNPASFSGNVRLTNGASVNAWSTNTGTGC